MPADRYALYAAELVKSGNTDFRLAGEVVDAEGQAVEGVRIVLTLSGYSATPNDFGDYRRDELTGVDVEDHTFDLRLEDWSSVKLLFVKDGYYRARASFAARGLMEAADAILAGRSDRPPPVRERDLRIVMEKLPEDPPMLLHYTGLSYDVAGQDTVIGFAHPLPEKRSWHEQARGVGLTYAEVSDWSTWPADGIVLLADEDDGRLIWEPVPEWIQNKWQVVQGLRLVATAEGAGFIRFKPQQYPDRGEWKLTYREMKRAPAGGYEPVLELLPVDQRPIMRNYNTGQNVYFWLRTGDGRFGKGMISAIAAGRGSEKITVYASVYLNPIPRDRRLEDGRGGWGEDPPEKAMEQPEYAPMAPR